MKINISISRKHGESPVASDYLVVVDRDKPNTWHLPVKRMGVLNRRLMGAARAALTVGFRGNLYQGPQKVEALKKLMKLYEKI